MMSIFMRLVITICFLFYAIMAWAGRTPTASPPTVSIVNPANNSSFVAPASISIAANAADKDGTIAKVDFYINNTYQDVLLGSKTTAPYTLLWKNVMGGTYTVKAVATDNTGLTGISSIVSISVTGDKISIINPVNGAQIYGGNITINGLFNGDWNARILLNNGYSSQIAEYGGSVLEGYTFSATLPVLIGKNDISALVVQSDKSTSIASVTIQGLASPALSLLQPVTRVFDEPANVTFQVDAYSPGGNIKQIDFLNNGALLSSVTSSPYQYTWANLAKGNYSMSIRAMDNNGVSTLSSLSFVVRGPNILPSVDMVAPSNNSAFAASSTITLQANAADSDGSIEKVEFFQGSSLLSSTNISPYKFDWTNVPLGNYVLTAQATDDRGGTSRSLARNISVISPPSVMLFPSTNIVGVGSNILLTANVTETTNPIAKVEFYVGGQLLGSSSNAPFSYQWVAPPLGTYLVSAKAIDSAGVSQTSAATTISVVTSPTVSVTSPTESGSYYTAQDITISASASQTGHSISSVSFYQNGTLLGTSTSAPYSFKWKGVLAGNYSLTAVATNEQGVAGTSAPVAVTVKQPSIVITEPADGATIAGSYTRVRGTIDAPPYSGVTVNGQVAIFDDSNGFYVDEVTILNGSNALSATLTTVDEVISTQTISVNATPADSLFEVDIVEVEGIGANFPFSFNVDSRNKLQNVEVDFNGTGGWYSFSVNDPYFSNNQGSYAFSIMYSLPKFARPMVRVTDILGNSYSKQFAVRLYDPSVLDQMLKTLWARMFNKVKESDVAVALTAFTGDARIRYQPMLENVLPRVTSFANQFGTLERNLLSTDSAEYILARDESGTTMAYPVYFIRCKDGVWRIDGM